jgi:hypothetical protein
MTRKAGKKIMKEDIARRLALTLAVLCVRNTYLEDLHAGKSPASKTGDYSDVKVVTPYGEIPWTELSRFNDTEIRTLMTEVVDKLYTILLRLEDEAFIERLERYARQLTHNWDEPKELTEWMSSKNSVMKS